MGTYTYHTLTLFVEVNKNHNYSAKEIISHLRSEYKEAEYALDENGNTKNEAKWYNSDTDLEEFSKKYPSIVFKLTQCSAQGDKEERDFKWDTSYKNGKVFSGEKL